MTTSELRTADFDFQLPPELIAQEPTAERPQSRLLVLNRTTGERSHLHFSDLPALLHYGDLLVANRSRVIPARLEARKESGGRVELLLVRPLGGHRWRAMARPGRRLRAGMELQVLHSDLTARLETRHDDGDWTVLFCGDGDLDAKLHRAGSLPLPPYIHNAAAPQERYQTVYADRDGSVAAPTAGLHFSHELLDGIRSQGIRTEFVTLHVGPGTFKPVSADRVTDHHLHAEWGELPQAVADAVNETRAQGHRVIAVGTTSTRLLETAWHDGKLSAFTGETDRFIYPGYQFRAIDGLITNFHLPKSTLLMLVCAFAGTEQVLNAYREAVTERYRFYSFGDAMFLA